MFRSLRVRIALSHALVLFVILVLLGVTLQYVLARTLDASVTSQLRASAGGVATRIDEAERPVPPPDSDVPSNAATQLAVYKRSGALVGEPKETPSWLRPGTQPVTDLAVSGERVRVVTVPVTLSDNSQVVVVAGRSMLAEDDLMHRVRMLLLAGSLLAVVASLAAGWWLAGRAVRPVERAYEARAAFAADASHELRTPLTFIRQGVEVLATNDPALGDQVLGEVDYMAGLSQRLLLLARAEGGPALDLKPVRVAAPIGQAAERSERALGLRLHIDGVDGLTAMADTTALEIALDAVFENVARHGGGSADVSAHREGSEIVIDVADAGPGLPTDLHGRAFDRFFRADPSRARETGGAGLGLALTQAWVEAQHGHVGLSETPGGGLTVSIELPAAAASPG
ncbi:MAG TPA: HAMP domain-containing sensor histidine kinase [Actinomycetota bacterium]|nr:HAMP domain-containing sensor histidine kinase [Actinomycetota bacterium]